MRVIEKDIERETGGLVDFGKLLTFPVVTKSAPVRVFEKLGFLLW